jgi:hypothetical protein
MTKKVIDKTKFTDEEAKDLIIDIRELRNLRCVVKLGDQIESVLEAEESIVLDHVNETFKAYDEDFKFVQIIITHPHHMNRYKYVDDETNETVVIKEEI